MSPAGTNVLAQASIPMRPVGSALLCVCVSISCWNLCEAGSVWHAKGSLLCYVPEMDEHWSECSMAPLGAIAPSQLSRPLSPSLSISLGLELNSLIPLCVYWVCFYHFILTFVWPGIFPMHLSSEHPISVCFITLHENLEQLFIEAYICWLHVCDPGWIRMLMDRKMIDWLGFWSCCCPLLQIIREGNQFFRASRSSPSYILILSCITHICTFHIPDGIWITVMTL